MKIAIIEKWDKVTEEEILSFVDSMPEKISVVIEVALAGGEYHVC